MTTDFEGRRIVSVLLSTCVDSAYSYFLPAGVDAVAGSFVRVPLRSRFVAGIIWDCPSESVDPKKIRTIDKVFDCPPIECTTRRFIERVAAYTLSPRGFVVSMMLSVPEALEYYPHIEALRCVSLNVKKITSARRRILESIHIGCEVTRSDLARKASVSSGVIDSLLSEGVFEKVRIVPSCVAQIPDPDFFFPKLTFSQEEAARALVDLTMEEKCSITLLYGVTGSGKTEVYFEAIASSLKKGKQVLILLPEIALTQVFLNRFEHRFGAKPAQWHSNLSSGVRQKIWRQVAEGAVRVVAGTRSALFLPFKNIGLIVVDEEHDTAYKQEDHLVYNARDMAVLRGHIENFSVVLASATPSVETQVNVFEGRYSCVRLSGRFADAALPEIRSLDMRLSPPDAGKFISPTLIEHIQDKLGKREQTLLFLNRRGYAPLTLCRKCGHRLQCPHCTAWLVEHRARAYLLCHHCGYSCPRPHICPTCEAFDHFVSCGPGIEKIAEEVACCFPQACITILSSDSPGGMSRLRLDLESIAKGETDIVIGTQLVAKGYHFPHMTLIGIIDADLGLFNADPRAGEKTFQLLNQVIGRAGRTGKKSLALLQTYHPENPLMKTIISGSADDFYAREIEERQRSNMPPFGRLAGIIVSALQRSEAENHAQKIRRAAPNSGDIYVLGPAEAPLAIVRGRHRMRLLVHGQRRAPIQTFIREMLKRAPPCRGSVRVQVDIDPQSFF